MPLQNYSIDISNIFQINELNQQTNITTNENNEIIVSQSTQFEKGKQLFSNIWLFIDEHIFWIKFIYLLVCVLLLLKTAKQIVILTWYFIKSPKEKRRNYTIVVNDRFDSPFTFFKWVFIPKDQYQDKDLENIIAHEHIHATQYHSLDY